MDTGPPLKPAMSIRDRRTIEIRTGLDIPEPEQQTTYMMERWFFFPRS